MICEISPYKPLDGRFMLKGINTLGRYKNVVERLSEPLRGITENARYSSGR
jgi:hypothetical protein